MYILAIETTGPKSSAAILKDGSLICMEQGTLEMSHLKDLTPMIGRVAEKAGIKMTDLTYIAVSKGPGSYTGIRIGVSTARALAQALNIKLIGVPTLEAVFCKETAKIATSSGKTVIPVINARRGQCYGMIRDTLAGGLHMFTDVEKAVEENKIDDPIYFLDGADIYVTDESKKAPETDRYQDAASVGKMAFEMLDRGFEPVSCFELLPDYMKKVEAEEKLEKGEIKL